MNRRLLLSAASASFLAGATVPAPAAEENFVVEPLILASAYRALVDEYLSGVLRMLQVAAVSQEAQSGQWQNVKELVSNIAERVSTQGAVWYALPDGSYSTADKGPTSENLKDRAYFPNLMSGKAELSALVISKSSGHRSVIVAAPVISGGMTVAALGVSVRVVLLSTDIRKQAEIPDNFIFYALDPKGMTALHRDSEKMFEYPSDLGDASLQEAVESMLSKPSGALHYSFEGKQRDAVFTRSSLTGWTCVLARVAS